MSQQQWMMIAMGLINQGYTWPQVQQALGPMPQPSPFGQAAGGLLTGLGGLGQLGMEMAPYNLQMQAARTGMNPAAMAAGINTLTKPLSKQLVGSVTRNVAPGIAGSGLATAPGMSTQILGEALAPYQLREQELGQQAYLEGLRMPFGVGAGLAGAAPGDLFNYSQILSALMNP